MVGGKCIAKATSATFHIAAQTEDASTKDSTGNWAENEVTGLSWDASTDCLVTLDTDTTGQEVPSLKSLMIAAAPVTLVFDTTDGTQNRTAKNSAIKMSGNAYITDISITAANRQNSTTTVQFTGTGALA